MLRRPNIALASVILGLFILLIPSLLLERSAKKELDALRSKKKELSSLISEYRSLKDNVDSVEKRSAIIQTRGIADAMDTLLSSLGIKGKMKSVKAVGNREIQGSMAEESAEVQIEKLTLNELVNMFYRINEAPMILSVKRVTIRKSFEKPELLDITMTIALFTRK